MRIVRPSLLLLLVALVCASASCTRSTPSSEKASPGSEGGRSSEAVKVNMPSLVGRNIDQIRKVLGPPVESTQSSVGMEPTAAQMQSTKGEGWINTFEYSGSTVVATFNARTRKVRDLVLIGSNEEELMRRGNLSLVSPDYVVLPVNNPTDPAKITGIRVVARK
ncbi:hypothetical protein F0P96_17890 [Hymenobacter busanensis]|uniref:Uncharacterized protein n=1 Tax=Hymenobacter busanensis TaxID=2607656 RepID=A0A7L4ZSP4_9BACT|nr:hypothetical protein [Hymenobacter busanensis]KAA9327111.1 hypothetical protein F0P96_17890 [Hymenobacter busanensis]QHJ05776.1 hypothetical protein GUY19_00090 [Hymenobacter busanensis]